MNFNKLTIIYWISSYLSQYFEAQMFSFQIFTLLPLGAAPLSHTPVQRTTLQGEYAKMICTRGSLLSLQYSTTSNNNNNNNNFKNRPDTWLRHKHPGYPGWSLCSAETDPCSTPMTSSTPAITDINNNINVVVVVVVLAAVVVYYQQQ